MNKLDVLKELNVLYVDDDIETCKSLEYILKYYFKTVLTAYDGQEAWQTYTNNDCHLLMVDYDMPIMNGYEFLSKVRETDDNIPAFIISSYDDKIKLKNAIKLNLLEYIVKPYSLDELKGFLYLFIEQVEKKGLLKRFISENCYYDMTKKIIIQKDKQYKLTSYEIKIFEYFFENKNNVITYEELLYLINSNNQKSLISIIYKINKKLPTKLIENIKDVGYKLNL